MTYFKDYSANFVDLLSYRSQNQSPKTAYTFLKFGEAETESLTYEKLHLKSQAIAAVLQSLNAVGERALLLYPPGLDFIAAFFGCLYAGVIAVPAYPPRRNQNLSRLQAIATDAQAKFVLTCESLLPHLQTSCHQADLAISGLHWLASDRLSNDLAQAWLPPKLDSDTLAFLQYTSGSTGDPKGVMVTHGNLIHNSAVIHQLFGHSANSQGLIWLPPYHDMGLIGGILQPLYGGFPVTLMSAVDFLQQPMRWLQAISRYQGTTSGGPNFAYDLCVSKVTPEQLTSLDLSSWEVAFTGAEPIRAETLERFTSTFATCGFRKEAFYPCYGMAETTLMISGGEKTASPIVCHLEAAALAQNHIIQKHHAPEHTRTLISCGKTPPEHQIIIVHPTSLTLCPPLQVGEIWVTGPSIAQGYWNRSEQTATTFHCYLADTAAGPFLRTGDLGFFQDGELFITGRLKDVIIIRGQNHYPQDIEKTVENSHPALRKNYGAAFTIDVQGAERLVIVQEVERSCLRKLNVPEVIGSIKQAVTAQHGLEVFSTVLIKTASIPKTSSGKIRRQACRDAFLNGSLDVIENFSTNSESKLKFKSRQSEVNFLNQQMTSMRKL